VTRGPASPLIWRTDSTTNLLQVVAEIPGAIGYAQAGNMARLHRGGVAAFLPNGPSGRFGDIRRSFDMHQFYTAELSLYLW
jgi:hypothetical protein